MDKWNGQGLPPVGEVCRIYSDKRDIEGKEILVVGKGVLGWLVVQCTESASLYEVNPQYHVFEPLKSEADRKRDEAVEKLYIDVVDIDALDTRYFCERLHDAGYRKVTPLTDEQIKSHAEARMLTYQTEVGFAHGAKWARSQILGEES